jgi:hypothetical protein
MGYESLLLNVWESSGTLRAIILLDCPKGVRTMKFREIKTWIAKQVSKPPGHPTSRRE